MISKETIIALARRYQTSEFPNIVREYFQHVLLSGLYQLPDADKMLFKGGTALRIVYGSPRFSEDLDFSLFGVEQRSVKKFIEDIFIKVLAETERTGIHVEIDSKSNETAGGYFGAATFRGSDYQPVSVEINISTRNGKKVFGETDSIVNDFVPAYTILHLPQEELVEEKIFGALLERKKPRDFYDAYFIMRKGMLTPGQKERIAKEQEYIIAEAKKINFQNELRALLPIGQQAVIQDFTAMLEREFSRQLAPI
ncbi:nucleotidyl transferase AbiEii/AbiGii toxin family protein [Candidatus Parcubacteria bacterium]|nr:nucleotidyl transferase AbiEii/AbiGii toxin family protein [Patescibacteria group bacterium]MBU4466462.1 nucleotidyl transferase AbiEii/AbiGii toxin family protein [Patescibacteria group bacterium]MCG2688209.1 nucleotidyl transferase AbiEii/AbiGii toxin family protein [Candidatus Parcubacteria bacterium]